MCRYGSSRSRPLTRRRSTTEIVRASRPIGHWGDGLRGVSRRSHWLQLMRRSRWYGGACAAGGSPERPPPGDMPRVWLEASRRPIPEPGRRTRGLNLHRCRQSTNRKARSHGRAPSIRPADSLPRAWCGETARRTDARGSLVRALRRSASPTDLGAKAGRLMAFSDLVLYGEAPAELGARSEILEEARALFEALGKVKTS